MGVGRREPVCWRVVMEWVLESGCLVGRVFNLWWLGEGRGGEGDGCGTEKGSFVGGDDGAEGWGVICLVGISSRGGMC